MNEAKGFSIVFRGSGYEPCIINKDMSVKYIFPIPLSRSAQEARADAEVLAAQSGLPYIVYAEVTSNA